MEILSQRKSLFDYLSSPELSSQALDASVLAQRQDNRQSLVSIEAQIGQGSFDNVAQSLEDGTLNISQARLSNYHQLKKDRLEEDLAQLASQYGVTGTFDLSVEEGRLRINSDHPNAESLNKRLQKDERLAALAEQTSRLSKLIEWHQAKEQAKTLKADGVDDNTIVSFLTDARKVISEPTQLRLKDGRLLLGTEGYSEDILKQYFPVDREQDTANT